MNWLLVTVVSTAVVYLTLCFICGRDFAFLVRLALRRRKIERKRDKETEKLLLKAKTQATGA